MKSEILGRNVSYSIYLPFDYKSSKKSYPVVYLLHGGGGNETELVRGCEVHSTADLLINNRAIPPIIMVMPDAGTTRYLNNYDGSIRYEDFFFSELIPHIESNYRAISEKRYRAVAGISMGGYGSLVYAFRHTDMFAAAASISGSFCEEERVLSMSNDQWNNSTRGAVYGFDLQGKDRFTKHYLSNDPCYMVENGNPDIFNTVSLYIDCGDDDLRNDGNAKLHTLMRRRGVLHEYRVRDGSHTTAYFRSGTSDALRFIGKVFRGLFDELTF
jgi:enterochelin esterase-like enzyme